MIFVKEKIDILFPSAEYGRERPWREGADEAGTYKGQGKVDQSIIMSSDVMTDILTGWNGLPKVTVSKNISPPLRIAASSEAESLHLVTTRIGSSMSRQGRVLYSG